MQFQQNVIAENILSFMYDLQLLNQQRYTCQLHVNNVWSDYEILQGLQLLQV